ncbi:MAG: tellurite resistance TerB family protein [Streptomyces sp.]|uniref:tellurite resistance TerB family protein n=1 Tax=unclassified Streptomyces TaxID=2593676 RepID=UPI0017B8C28D|nr:tellurite resistance TerB family protein [Streptomyces sp.]NUR38850.1 tellurite resistance TerB family protein [Streptomyces sp.]NUR67998.1 tellurite resistance TerB family protein [Streptomyces sp.]NUS27613.1 tellurite resistance TerB family protein [Streptomyces sp.]NUS75611.1 tellurite resistance TerB family protein [Streptomyces sp.]
MALFDRLKDQAKGLQQQVQGGGHGTSGGHGSGSRGGSHGGGSRAQLVGLFKTQLGSIKTELKSGAYRDASMAMCALVAAADGQVDASEMQQMESMILSNEVLQNFPPEQLRTRFHKHVEQLTRNFAQGKSEALQDIAKAAKKPAEARAVVQTGIVIAGADGHFSQAEQMVLREACTALNLNPAEFQL